MSFLFLFAFMHLFVLFVLVKFYRKKIKKSKITPDNLIHYTTFSKTLFRLSKNRAQNYFPLIPPDKDEIAFITSSLHST